MLTVRFDSALAYASAVHVGQVRKGTTVPYVAHLLAVCGLVLEDKGDEDEAIAALLHDAVEDGGGPGRLADIRARFGDRVADIVWACSDTAVVPKPPWKERKSRYVAHVREASPSARRVSCADKAHNARAILRDYRELGEDLWGRFNAPSDEQLWYHRELVKAFRQPDATPLVDELDRVVAELEAERGRVRVLPRVLYQTPP
jgi:(p)ppGpp synthase/HD superfamily hydrolase